MTKDNEIITGIFCNTENVVNKTFYLPLYSTDGRYWLCHCLCESMDEAIDLVSHLTNIKAVRFVRVSLPVVQFADDIDTGGAK